MSSTDRLLSNEEVILRFDELNSELIVGLSESITKMIPNVFPDTLSNIPDSKLRYSTVNELTIKEMWPTISDFLEVISSTLGTYYLRHHGLQWKHDKIAEMNCDGLVYLWYQNGESEIVGFISFLMALEESKKVLYLYEVHVLPQFQSKRVGSTLLRYFHHFAIYLNSQATADYQYSSCFNNLATNLTVFSDNLKALSWYFKLGYRYTDLSPRDKVLRNGKVIKPEYYLLTRPNLN